jgi:hypothetical protein
MAAVGDVCVCCGGIEGGSPTGGEVDPVTGLCVTCQPCERCGEYTHPADSRCPGRHFE